MKIVTDIVKIFINDIELTLRKFLIKKSDLRIERLKNKLKIEEKHYKELLKNTIEFCEKARNYRG